MRIKIDRADIVFSQYIRLRDKQCRRCGSPVRLNDAGLPISHNCSHFHGRGHEGTRYEPDNCDTLCYPCHQLWEKDERAEYEDFKKKQLGINRFKTLKLQANTYFRKDRKKALEIAKELLKSLIFN